VLGGAKAESRPDALDIRTSTESFGYQMLSPAFVLHPGAYAVVVDGTVRRGGLGVGVLDTASRRFVVQNLYSADQQRLRTNFVNGRMVANFSLASTARLQLILSNSAPGTDTASQWRLTRLTLFRQKRPCGCSPHATDAWISSR